MMLPYLKYINDPSHKWYSCFGVPYATHIWQVADASSLNGAYKIELARAKRRYVERRDTPRFEPTDIVPLVNMSFPKSFGNRNNAVKAISERGWNPINYNILTNLPSAKNIVDLTTEADSQANATDSSSNHTGMLIPKLNINLDSGSYYLDRLIEEEKKSEDRKKKFEDMKSEHKTKQQKLDHLKKLTKVSSATLAANNHYSLNETMLEMVLDKHDANEAARIAVQQRKDAAESKRAETLKNALQKFSYCPNSLTVPDIKALVVAVTKASDSPVKKKKDELQQQLYREPRYGRVQAMVNEFRLTENAAAAAEALVGLNTPILAPPASETAVASSTPV